MYPTLEKAVIYERFINDMIFIAIGKNLTENIITAMEKGLVNVAFQITTKLFNTKCTDQQVEYLDFSSNIYRTHHLNFSHVFMSKKLLLAGLL